MQKKEGRGGVSITVLGGRDTLVSQLVRRSMSVRRGRKFCTHCREGGGTRPVPVQVEKGGSFHCQLSPNKEKPALRLKEEKGGNWSGCRGRVLRNHFDDRQRERKKALIPSSIARLLRDCKRKRNTLQGGKGGSLGKSMKKAKAPQSSYNRGMGKRGGRKHL